MIADPVRNGAGRQLPNVFRHFAVLRVGHNHVGWQAVGKGTDFTRRTAGGGLTGQGERAVARLGNLADQQVHVVDHVIDPGAARMLVEAHSPEGRDLDLGIGVGLGQRLQLVLGHAGNLVCLVQRVFGNELGEIVEADRLVLARVALRLAIGAGVAVVHRHLFQRVVRTQAVADVGDTLEEVHVLLHEGFIHRLVLDDVVADVVEDGQVGLRLEDQFVVRQFAGTMTEGRQHVDLDVLGGQATVGDARPEDRVHLGHVRAPQREHVSSLNVVVAAHRLVDTESAHETGYGRSHAVTGIRIQAVGTQTGFPQLGGGIAFPHRPLTGTEHRHAARALVRVFQGCLDLFGHDVEGLVPGNRRELAVLVELTVLHPQHRLGQAVLAVLDLGQEVALDAVQALVDRRIRVTLGGDNTAILGADEHTATGTAVTAGALVPADAVAGTILGEKRTRCGHAGGHCGCGNRVALDELTPRQFDFRHFQTS